MKPSVERPHPRPDLTQNATRQNVTSEWLRISIARENVGTDAIVIVCDGEQLAVDVAETYPVRERPSAIGGRS
jgi:hypothetical protein